MEGNAWEWWKTMKYRVKWMKIVENGGTRFWKQWKLVENGGKWWKTVEMVKNGKKADFSFFTAVKPL